ncbi:expressed unknown protein [Seminavis robusta]|uniref:Uncharacterized protein n=1 Tax=Seminavis robusta TaxID=568900 RepID=A0A9N8HUV6_9STRA|nr:expressed unknown protein [Seminavis robusta]|eukprot:Sro2174_g317660.1 n/a (396) ;mRNA; f:2417-3604
MLDWKDVLPILKESTKTVTDPQASVVEEQLIEGFWMLHRKWFDQGRASGDHLPTRCDLCHNVLNAIIKVVVNNWNSADSWRLQQDDNFTKAQEYLIDLWSLWYDMWIDLLQLPVGVDEDIGSIGTMGYKVLWLSRDMGHEATSTNNIHDNENNKQQTLVYPAHLLALVDPTATWFHAWVVRMTPVELVRLANFEQVCPDLWQRANTDDGTTKKVFLLQHQSNAVLLPVAMRQHSLSMIRSILACTRLQWFPAACTWENKSSMAPKQPQQPLTLDKLKQECEEFTGLPGKPDGNQSYADILKPYCGISAEQSTALLDLFLKVGDLSGAHELDQDKVQPIAAICAEAIETILLGMPLIQGEEAASSNWMSQHQDRCGKKDKTCFEKLLARVLKNIEP